MICKHEQFRPNGKPNGNDEILSAIINKNIEFPYIKQDNIEKIIKIIKQISNFTKESFFENDEFKAGYLKTKFPEIYNSEKNIETELTTKMFEVRMNKNILIELNKQNEIITIAIEKALQTTDKKEQREIIIEAIKNSKDKNIENNIISVFRYMPLVFNKYDNKNFEKLKETLTELSEEEKLNLTWKNEIDFSSILAKQNIDNCILKNELKY